MLLLKVRMLVSLTNPIAIVVPNSRRGSSPKAKKRKRIREREEP